MCGRTGNMNIETIGHDRKHELWLVARLFFDDEEQKDVSITSSAVHRNGLVTVDTQLVYQGRRYTGRYSYPCHDDADKRIKARIVCAVAGMSFYNTVQKVRPKSLPWGVMTGIRPAKPVRRMLMAGKTEADVYAYMKNLYGVTDQKIKLAVEVAKNEIDILRQNTPDKIGLYIGIPFCPTRCLYCSFVSSDMRYTKKYMDDYCELLAREIEHSAALLKSAALKIDSIYIGGGTPTSLTAEKLSALLKAIHTHFDLSYLKEFSIEAGRPDTITPEKLTILKDAQVDRISINPQTMNIKTLQIIGRNHTPDDILKAFDMARAAGVWCINADIIAGLPGETEHDFAYTLSEIDKLSPENITVHTLSIKRGSKLNQHKESYRLSEAETVENMLCLSRSFMQKTNRAAYYMYRQKNMLGNLENVGYAKKGYMSRYNVNIMEEEQTILALGAGGVSKVIIPSCDRIERIFNFKTPAEYISRFNEILTKKDEFLRLATAENKT